MEGNQMKTREALEQIFSRFNVDGLGRHWIRLNEYDWQLIQSALSAPPRNCDRFATGEDALKAWQAYQRKHMEFDERWRTWDCIGWLYALAKTEGGAE